MAIVRIDLLLAKIFGTYFLLPIVYSIFPYIWSTVRLNHAHFSINYSSGNNNAKQNTLGVNKCKANQKQDCK